MTMDAPGDSAPRLRWPFYALIASLAVNLLFVGWVGGQMWHYRKGPGGRGGDEVGLMRFAGQLPDAQRQAFRARLKAARDTVKPLRTAVDAAWTAANATLTTEPFDKVAAKAAFTAAVDADARLRSTIDDELIGLAEGLSADERKTLQAWREKHKPKMLRHHGRKDKNKDKDEPKGEPAEKGAE